MKKSLVRTLILWAVLLLGLAGCAASDTEDLQPLDPKAWPTAIPTVVKPTRTPFRVVAPAPTVTPDGVASSVPPTVAAATIEPAAAASAATSTGVPAEITIQPSVTPDAVLTPASDAAASATAQSVSASPQASGGGLIVLQVASGSDIMVIDGSGANLRRLTAGLDPALSPDRQRVAFTRWQGDIGSVWIIGVDGTGERQLLDGLRKAKGTEWSPDGTQIVVNYQHEGRLESERVCKAMSTIDKNDPGIPWNASDVDVEVRRGVPYLCWTVPPDEHWALQVIDVASGKHDDLFGGVYAFHPTWDPSRPWRIVTAAGDGLLETSVNGDHSQNITTDVADRAPVFSPDGRYLAVVHRDNGRWEIERLNTDGSGRVRLTSQPLWTLTGPGKQKPWNNVAPCWSPDGSQIAFLTDRTGRWEIWTMNADGSQPHALFPDSVNQLLPIQYDFGDERVFSWR